MRSNCTAQEIYINIMHFHSSNENPNHDLHGKTKHNIDTQEQEENTASCQMYLRHPSRIPRSRWDTRHRCPDQNLDSAPLQFRLRTNTPVTTLQNIN